MVDHDASPDRLDSWKEIAAHLDRDIRTVQRWEKDEGLPVHRHRHKKQGTVYASRVELDAWLSGREPRTPETRRARSAVLALAAVFGLVVAAVALYRSLSGSPDRALIAVLPLENLSQDATRRYFSDGMTEELIAQLGRLHPERLGVIAWTTSRRYADTDKPVREIGSELGVTYVLEGGVRREEERVRVNARLIRVRDEAQIWSETYDQELSSVLLVQRDVARDIARQIRVRVAPDETPSAVRALNVDAYDAFLRGRQDYNRWSGPGFMAAIQHFETAIALDESYALAHGWRAMSYATVAFFGFVPPREAFPIVREAARQSLALDPAVAEARLALGWSRFAYDWEWDAAEATFQQVLDDHPGAALPHWFYAWFLTAMNRHDDARVHIQRALEIDPLNPYINTGFGDMLALWGDDLGALEQYRRTLEGNPHFAWPHHLMAAVHAHRGDFAAAVDAERLYLSGLGASETALQSLEAAYEASGGDGFWSWHIAQLEERSTQHPSYSTPRLAIAYAQLGDADTALEWLERAYEKRLGPLVFLNVNSSYDGLRDDPRFEALIARVGFPGP